MSEGCQFPGCRNAAPRATYCPTCRSKMANAPGRLGAVLRLADLTLQTIAFVVLWAATAAAMAAHLFGMLAWGWTPGKHWTWWIALVGLVAIVVIGLYARFVLDRPDPAGDPDV